MTLLALRDVTGARGGRVLFEGLSLAVAAGAALLVTGPNGAGKSSLIRIAAGLLSPATGTVERPDRAALLAEAAALDGEATVAAALRFWATIDGGEAPAARADAALAAVALAPLAAVPVRLLSTGQRRRVALARVVASGAPLWLLDEPANGLDAGAVATLEALVARHRDAGGAVVVASHLPMALPGAATLELGG